MDPSTSAEALKLEIARLTGAINRRKTEEARPPAVYQHDNSRSNVYVNPNYKPPSKPVPPVQPIFKPRPFVRPTPQVVPAAPKDVIIGGIAFESSGRSLVRKDLAKSVSVPKPPVKPPPHRTAEFSRNKAGTLMNTNRAYKPKSSSRRPIKRNMTLNNTVRPFQSVSSSKCGPGCPLLTSRIRSRRQAAKKAKYVDKPCPRFTTTGACTRGLTCMYQHDPSKVVICWSFLQGNCPNTAETCNLSHDPTPERTPLCLHFANQGRCTRQNCPFPHVRVGQRSGVCRDFAVLGYCEKGLDCDKQHVRECPDFAEKGACTTKGCKLPHVIRANRNRKAPAPQAPSLGSSGTNPSDPSIASQVVSGSDVTSSHHDVSAEDAQLGDEFISLTFHESESEESDDEEDDDGGEDEEEQVDNDSLKVEM